MTWRTIVGAFGRYVLNRPDATLCHRGVPVDDDGLDAQALDLLALLLSRNGQTVSHVEIMAELWPRGLAGSRGRLRRPTVDNVHRAKGDIVAVLERVEFDDSWLQVVRGIGYAVRFPPPVARTPLRVAVLPLRTGDELAAALAPDLLVGLLTRIRASPELVAVANSVVAPLARAALPIDELAARSRSDLVVSARIDTRQGTFAVEAEIVSSSGILLDLVVAIAETLEAAASIILERIERAAGAIADDQADPGPGDRDSAERFALAADYFRRRDFVGLVSARRMLEQIVAVTDDFLAAKVLLADVTSLLGTVGFMELEPVPAFGRARALVEDVLARDPDNASAMATSGFIDFAHGHDLPSGARKLQTARQLDPASDKPRLWLAHLELVTGHSESAFAEIDAAQRASPTNPLVFASVGWLRLLDGRIGEALEWGAEATVRFEDFSPGRLIYGLALEGAGRYEEAEREFLAARDIALGPPRQSTGHALVPMAALGHLYATTRRRTGAREILEWLVALRRDRFVSSYLTALVRVGLGEADAALDDLARARIERCDWLVHLALDPRWRPLRRRRRFAALVASLGLGEPR